MSRKSKISEQEFTGITAVPEPITPDTDPATITNINATRFCPFINHQKREFMHRKAPAKIQTEEDLANPANRVYHFWQTKEYTSVQFCTLKREPETDIEKCECRFEQCELYKKETIGE